MNLSDLSFFSLLDDLSESNIRRTPSIINIQEQNVEEWGEDNLTLLLEALSEHSDWFRRPFSIEVVYESSRAAQSVVSYNRDFDSDLDLLDELVGTEAVDVRELSVLFRDGDLHAASQLLYSIISSSTEEFVLSATVQKDKIVDTILEECGLDVSDVDFSLWRDRESLSSWVTNSETEDVLSQVFGSDVAPFHLFVDGIEDGSSDYLGFHSVQSLFNGDTTDQDIRDVKSEYEEANQTFTERLDTPQRLDYQLSPVIFDTDLARAAYTSCFLYSAFACFSETTYLDGDTLSAKIITYRHRLESDVDLRSLSFGTEELLSVYQLCDRALNQTQGSIAHWRQAVARYCETLEEIPTNKQQIIHYQGFLRDEAATEELEKVQSAIDDAIGLTQTLSESISDATQSLSSNLQTVIFALLGAIVSNFVLILRYSEFPVLFPFSTVAIAGILLFYMPLVQRRINSTLNLIANREQDFLLHFSDIRSQVGDSIYNFDDLDARREEYVSVGERAVKDTQSAINRVFLLLLVTWVVIQLYAFIVTVENFDQLKVFLAQVGIYSGQATGNTIQVTRTFAAVPATWLLGHCIFRNFCSDQINIEVAENTQLETTEELHYNEEQWIRVLLLLSIIVFLALFEPVTAII